MQIYAPLEIYYFTAGAVTFSAALEPHIFDGHGLSSARHEKSLLLDAHFPFISLYADISFFKSCAAKYIFPITFETRRAMSALPARNTPPITAALTPLHFYYDDLPAAIRLYRESIDKRTHGAAR